MTLALVAILGLVMGSFAHTLAYRLSYARPLFTKRSICDACGEPVGFIALIPILGYLWLRGRSACCQKPIDRLYPLIEGASALVFIAIVLHAPSFWVALSMMVWWAGLLVMGLTDYWTLQLHDAVLYPWLGVSALICLLNEERVLILIGALVLVALVVGLARFMEAVLQKQTMGEGDYYVLFGLFLALRSASTLGVILMGSLIGILVGLVLKKKELPFVSLLALGSAILLLFRI
jgi:leader peptidase (prepilin peptidase)/N-methyltransferase